MRSLILRMHALMQQTKALPQEFKTINKEEILEEPQAITQQQRLSCLDIHQDKAGKAVDMYKAVLEQLHSLEVEVRIHHL